MTPNPSQSTELVEVRDILEHIATWRAGSAKYTDDMNLPRREMNEAQVIHIEQEARRALKLLANEIERLSSPRQIDGGVDIRGIALAAIKEMRTAGESHEMCARWISERVRAALQAVSLPSIEGEGLGDRAEDARQPAAAASAVEPASGLQHSRHQAQGRECESCDGTGDDYTCPNEMDFGGAPGSSRIDCPDCGGEGWIKDGECPECGGAFSKTCPNCGGTGDD